MALAVTVPPVAARAPPLEVAVFALIVELVTVSVPPEINSPPPLTEAALLLMVMLGPVITVEPAAVEMPAPSAALFICNSELGLNWTALPWLRLPPPFWRPPPLVVAELKRMVVPLTVTLPVCPLEPRST
jgi:hypothetical protein